MRNKKAMRKAADSLKRNLPTILAFISSFGVAATAVCAVKGTVKAVELEKNGDETKPELIKKRVLAYIPTIAFGAATIVCIFGGNTLSKKRQASMLSAYALVSESYQRYKGKIKELCGEDVHQSVLDSLAVEKAQETHIYAPSMFADSNLDFGDKSEPVTTRTFYDSFSKRYFESTIVQVIKAEYHLNRNFMLEGCVSLNDFYEFLGLPKTDYGNSVGWSICDEEICWIDFDHHVTHLDDGMEVCIIDMVYEPSPEF